MTEITTVAVVGLGPAGLVALKNLREEGFNATGFDRNSYIGGLWHYSTNEQTSVMESTLVNFSKERSCFTDFSYPEDVPSYPTASQVQQYLISFVQHFNLESRLRLNTSISMITFDKERLKWALAIEGQGSEYFDKVVIAIGGMVGLANVPVIENIERFAGTRVHTQAYKRPKDYAGKRVMVVGFSNSAADTATQLAGVADKVYMAHRHGARVLPRINGTAVDHTHSMRLLTVQSLVFKWLPRFGEKLFDDVVKKMQNKHFRIRPEWRFEPAGRVPVVSNTLVPCLEDGSIESVAGVKRISGSNEVELDDGNKVEIDAIIWATGYKSDFSLVAARFDPTCRPSSWLNAKGSNGKSLFRLYHNIFSLEKPESLAFLGNVHITLSGFVILDMASQAIAQVWKGASSLPSKDEMNVAVDRHHDWMADYAQRNDNVSPGHCETGQWVRAMDDLAGTGVNEYLGYGWKGWVFWLRDMRLCNLLMGGIWSPHIHRLFEGKRKAWSGAREAIEKVNERVAESRRGGEGEGCLGVVR